MKANRFLTKNDDAVANLIPLTLAVIIAFALLFVGNYINGTIHEELDNADPGSQARATMNNTSENWDAALSIVQVTIIITILAAAIGAIFLFTKFR